MLLKKMFGWCVLAAAFSAFAEVRLASPFADGMVLQRDREIAVWGTADAGERVKVSFAGHEVSAVVNDKGEWKAHLPKLPASKEGRVLTARSEKSGTRQTIKDVLVGEVWFVCGQSNAEMPLAGNVPHFADRQGRLVAQMTRKPHVRYAYASNYTWSPTPKKEASYPVVWKKFLPVHLGNPPSFSAMAVYFALELESALGIPVGLVGSYWGGSNIDAWTPRVGYEGKPELKETADWKIIPAEKWSPTNACAVVNGAHQQPTVMWNEMIEPWCPMTMRGFLWYQGCHSSGEGMLYAAKMQALYDGWAKKFENPGLKLYFVQLAPYSRSWWDVQIAQAKFAAREKNAAMVTTADIGNFADIHPSEKGTVGKRLAALALRHDYGFDICADAPVLAAIRAQEDRLHLSFENADGWYVYDPEWKLCGGFEIAGSDGVWKPAYIVNADNGKKEAEAWRQRGRIKGRDIVLASDGVRNPVKVRYLYRKPWVGTLFASSGLPLGPFEADISLRAEKLEQLPCAPKRAAAEERAGADAAREPVRQDDLRGTARVRRIGAAVEAKGCAPSTGIFSTRYMLMCLSEHGRRGLAEKIVLHRGFPGFGCT